MITDNLTKQSLEHLKKLRRKKTSNKRSDIFDCLTHQPEVKVDETKIPTKNEIDFNKRKDKYLYNLAVRKLDKSVRKKLRKEREAKEYEELCKLTDLNKGQRRRKRKLGRRLGFIVRIRKPRSLVKSKRVRKPSKYATYIKSGLWTQRKNKLFQARSRICEVCSSTSRISVHHLKYDSKEFGNEKDEDLAIVCWVCHEAFHKKYGVTGECHVQYLEFKQQYTRP